MAIASAASRMILSVTWFSHTYQLFPPMCSVSGKLSPQTILSLPLALPSLLAARKLTRYALGLRRGMCGSWAKTLLWLGGSTQ